MAATNRSYPLKHDGNKGTEDNTEAGRDGVHNLIYGDSDAKEDIGGKDYTPSNP